MKLVHFALAAVLSSTIATAASAHEVWIEHDRSGPAKIYFGEPVDVSEREIDRLTDPLVFTDDRSRPIAVTRTPDYLEAAVEGSDVRLYDENVFKPWKNDEGQAQASVFYARAGRSDTRALLDFEIVPVKANGDVFTVTFKGQPVPDAGVTLIVPDDWTKEIKADAQGRFTVPRKGAGRYILISHHAEDGDRQIGGEAVSRVYHVSTLSFFGR